jgi:hypothetical protein
MREFSNWRTWSLIFYEKYSTSLSTIILVVLTTANFGGFSNFCRYYTRSQTGKSTGYRPTLKPLSMSVIIAYISNLVCTTRFCNNQGILYDWTWLYEYHGWCLAWNSNCLSLASTYGFTPGSYGRVRDDLMFIFLVLCLVSNVACVSGLSILCCLYLFSLKFVLIGYMYSPNIGNPDNLSFWEHLNHRG